MNEFVEFVVPSLTRNSLIFTGEALRTFSCALSLPLVQRALATRSPLNARGPAVILNVAVDVSPEATAGSVLGLSTIQPAGTLTLNITFVTGAPVVFVNVT